MLFSRRHQTTFLPTLFFNVKNKKKCSPPLLVLVLRNCCVWKKFNLEEVFEDCGAGWGWWPWPCILVVVVMMVGKAMGNGGRESYGGNGERERGINRKGNRHLGGQAEREAAEQREAKEKEAAAAPVTCCRNLRIPKPSIASQLNQLCYGGNRLDSQNPPQGKKRTLPASEHRRLPEKMGKSSQQPAYL